MTNDYTNNDYTDDDLLVDEDDWTNDDHPKFDARECEREQEEEKTDANPGVTGKFVLNKSSDLPFIVDQLEKYLTRSGSIYQQGGRLVRIGNRTTQLPGGRTITVRSPIAMNKESMIDHLTRKCRWQKYDGRGKDYVQVKCPSDIAETLLSRTGMWTLPVLRAVISAPTLRADGSILEPPGYDHTTGLYYDPVDTIFPTIPQRPTKEAAQAALAALIDLVREVPFVKHSDHGNIDRSVFFSALLTAVIRVSLSCAPIHVFNAPMPGSGKSMLADALSIMVTGSAAAVISQGATVEEMEKRFSTALRSGDVVVCLDNCTQPIEGDLLCQAVTQPQIAIRVLGLMERVLIANTALYLATGNNLIVKGDMLRRTLRCTIDPRVENPGAREFTSVRPDHYMAVERAKFVAAALTLLRAFHVAGRPCATGSSEGFPDWSGLVRNAIIWLDQPDPWLATADTRAEDPDRLKTVRVFESWYAAFPGVPVSVADLMEKALYVEEPDKELCAALRAVADDESEKYINRMVLGRWISSHKGVVTAGYRISPATLRSGVARYQIDRVSDDTSAAHPQPLSSPFISG